MTQQLPPTISFIAHSGTGKTTLLTALISELKERGFRLGVIKHDAHKFEIDHPGKDSYRFTEAGADSMLITSASKLALVKRHQASPPVEELIADYFPDVDLVLIEGFKQSSIPKIEVYRAGYSSHLICRDERQDKTLVAVASDVDLEVDVPLLNLNKPSTVADFIVEKLQLNR